MVKWIKITVNMFDDEKIRIIESMPDADAILVIWIKLLTLAGKNNTNGFIFLSENIPYTDEMLSTIFNRPLNTVRLALQTFKQFGMIDYDDKNFLFLVNWEKHQNIEGLEKIREQTRKRVAKHRENQKALPSDVTLPVTQSNATEKNKNRKEKKENISTPAKQKYADFVTMTEEEHQKLITQFGERGTLDRIEKLSLYKGSTGKKYASDYLTILSWERKNKEQSKPSQKSYDDVPALTFDKPTMYATKD